MKITDVRARLVRCESSQPIKFAHLEIPFRNMILVEVKTDAGIIGLGEIDAYPTGDSAAISIVNGKFRDFLLDKNPLYIQKIWDSLFDFFIMPMGRTRSIEMYCIGGIDMALWDIIGKYLGQPVSRLLGGSRDRIQAYASLSYAPPEKIQDVVVNVKKLGFEAFKVRIGVESDKDEEIVRLAREAAGPDMHIMVDVNSGWNRREAAAKARSLEKYDISWIEEPLPSHDVIGMAELANRVDIPIAVGEHQIFNRYDARDLAVMKAGSIFQPDLRVGGISECRRIANIASAWDIPCVPHFFGNCIRLAAMAHLLGSISNAWLLEYDISVNPLRTELPMKPIEPVDGYIDIPTAPGLGVELNLDLLEQWTIE